MSIYTFNGREFSDFNIDVDAPVAITIISTSVNTQASQQPRPSYR
ncbi:hypothetical protein C4J86_2546 [Pseudomonas sp. R2-7-07]|nr:hypothetical protein C4J86_2546 [Pseudomonas sp. R2-7-07]